ncbi:PINIT domain-containing protein [Kalaharituber pfeilii]|nr:PINIT domain-containing protein [Kalaharituber pfeilii]
MASQPPQSTQALITYVSTKLIVRQLQTILRAAGLPSSGVKKTLQERLIDRILELSRDNEHEALDRLRSIIYKPESVAGTHPASLGPPGLPERSEGVPHINGEYRPYYPLPYYSAIPQGVSIAHFKSSPFYSILERLSSVYPAPAMNSHRNTIKMVVNLNQNQVTALVHKQAKALLYCGAIDSPHNDIEVGFPAQVEVRVNDQPIPQSQLRGLKNKPGSTRPPDITHLLIKSVGAINNKYAIVVNLVKVIPVEKLVDDLSKSNNRISKEAVIREMVKRNEDSDLVATSSVISLKCPLSTLRIELPVRSKVCTHVQCFDASSYLQLQQQAPTWTCPTCNKPVPFNLLVVDSYVQDILDATPKSVDSVTVDPNGNWSVASQRSPSADVEPNSDDEDIIEIQDSRQAKRVDPVSVASPVNTGSQEATAPRSASKRPIAQVIDLTLSDDDEPPRPPKRTAQLQTPSSSSSIDGRQMHRPIQFSILSRPSGSNSSPSNY